MPSKSKKQKAGKEQVLSRPDFAGISENTGFTAYIRYFRKMKSDYRQAFISLYVPFASIFSRILATSSSKPGSSLKSLPQKSVLVHTA